MNASLHPEAIGVQRITEWSAFAALRDDWNRLASSCAQPSLFLRHEWLDSAWQWASGEAQLHVLLARHGDDLIGALPLVVARRRVRSIERRVLEFLAVPDTQRCDVLAQPGDEARVCRAFVDALAAAPDWDMFELRTLQADGPAIRIFADALRARGHVVSIESGGSNPFVDLAKTWDAYYAARSRSLKKAANLAANRLRKAGTVEIDWHRPTGYRRDESEAVLASLIEISGRSWKQQTGNSLDHAGPQAFIRRLSELASAQGWLSVWTLALDGKPLAMEYQLIHDGDVYALRSDFDAEFGEISPGSHLCRQLLEQLFGAGLSRYCMGPGDNAYKQRWAEDAEALLRLVAYGRTARGRLARFVDLTLAPLVRAVRRRTVRSAPASLDAEGTEK